MKDPKHRAWEKESVGVERASTMKLSTFSRAALAFLFVHPCLVWAGPPKISLEQVGAFARWERSLGVPGAAPHAVIDEASLAARFQRWTAGDALAPYYAEDGCWGRAFRIAEDLGPRARKIWVFATAPNALRLRDRAVLPDGWNWLAWSFHVAVVLPVQLSDGRIRWRVVDPSIGRATGPMPLSHWLASFVEHPAQVQFVSSPGFVPRGFKHLDPRLPNTSAGDDEGGVYQDPTGDWHLRSWVDGLWSTLNRTKLSLFRGGDSKIPQSYQSESARRRRRVFAPPSLNDGDPGSDASDSSGLLAGETTSLVKIRWKLPAKVRVLTSRVDRLIEWEGTPWVALEGNPMWFRSEPGAVHPAPGQLVRVTVQEDRVLEWEWGSAEGDSADDDGRAK